MPITQQEVIERFRYEDGKLYWLARGYARFDKQFAGKEAGGFNKTANGIIIAYKNTRILLHRVVWIYHNGEIPEGMEIDHINQDRLDNRIENLRLCYRHQNAWNTKIRFNNKTGVKGLCWNPLTNTWRARVSVNKKTITVGSFVCFEEAKRAVELARISLHGEFANLGYLTDGGLSCH